MSEPYFFAFKTFFVLVASYLGIVYLRRGERTYLKVIGWVLFLGGAYSAVDAAMYAMTWTQKTNGYPKYNLRTFTITMAPLIVSFAGAFFAVNQTKWNWKRIVGCLMGICGFGIFAAMLRMFFMYVSYGDPVQ
jgi:hypothetical protein